MNWKTTLFRSPWRKVFLVFLQRQQGIVLRLRSFTQCIASFRKRLENVYSSCIVHRIEARHLPCDYEFLIIRPINTQSLLRSTTLTSSSLNFSPSLAGNRGLTLVKGHNETAQGSLKGGPASRIKFYPVIFFQSYPDSFQEGSKLARQKDLPIIIRQREIFNRMRTDALYRILPRIPSKYRILRETYLHEGYTAISGQDTGLFRWIDKTFLIKQLYRRVGIEEKRNLTSFSPVLLKREELDIQRQKEFIPEILHLKNKERYMEGVGSVSPAWRISMVTQETIRSMESYQRAALESAYGDIEYVRIDSGMVKKLPSIIKNLPLSFGGFGLKMYKSRQWDRKEKYVGRVEKLNSPEVPENIRLMYEGKHMERIARVYSGWGISLVSQETIRSMKSYQKSALESAYGDKGLYRDREHVRVDSRTVKRPPSMVKRLSSRSGAPGSKKDINQGDKKSKYIRGPEKLNSPEVPENIRLMYEGKHMQRIARVYSGWRISMIRQETIRSMKPYRRTALKSGYGDKESYVEKDYAGTDFRTVKRLPSIVEKLPSVFGELGTKKDINQWDKKWKKEIDKIHPDTSYAILQQMQDKEKRNEGSFNTIPNKIQEYPGPIPLNGEMPSFYGIEKMQNPMPGKKDIKEQGISIDYNKLADHVYEILTRRIIREKERLGELL